MIKYAAGYLFRRDLREQSRSLTQHLVLGWVLSLFLIGYGAYRYFAVIGAWDLLWRTVMWSGAAAAVLTLVVPAVWQGPEFLLRKVGHTLGTCILIALLTTIYYGLVWPMGALLRKMRGAAPIYSWSDRAPEQADGWVGKSMPPDLLDPSADRTLPRGTRSSVLHIFIFFVRRGNIIFVPLLILLASLGFIFFFLKSSALAPLIYSIF